MLEEINRLFRDVFDDDAITVDERTTQADIEGWDSLGQLRIVLAAQQQFRVRLTTADIDAIRTVGDLIRILQRRIEGRIP